MVTRLPSSPIYPTIPSLLTLNIFQNHLVCAAPRIYYNYLTWLYYYNSIKTFLITQNVNIMPHKSAYKLYDLFKTFEFKSDEYLILKL